LPDQSFFADGIQQGKGGFGSCQLHQLQRCRHGFKIIHLRPARDNDHIGEFGGSKGSLLSSCGGVDNGEAYSSVLGFAEGIFKPCGQRVYDNPALRLPPVAPIAGGRLWV
jgi:hypothetical protein